MQGAEAQSQASTGTSKRAPQPQIYPWDTPKKESPVCSRVDVMQLTGLCGEEHAVLPLSTVPFGSPRGATGFRSEGVFGAIFIGADESPCLDGPGCAQNRADSLAGLSGFSPRPYIPEAKYIPTTS